MKDCPEISELIANSLGDDVVGFLERKLVTSEQEIIVMIPVHKNHNPLVLN